MCRQLLKGLGSPAEMDRDGVHCHSAKKDEITNRYRNALNKEFDKLKIGDDERVFSNTDQNSIPLRLTPKHQEKSGTNAINL